MNLKAYLTEVALLSFQALLDQEGVKSRPLELAVSNKKYAGDYQVNGLLSLPKGPEYAGRLVEQLKQKRELPFSEVSVTGGCFVNLRLQDGWILRTLIEAVPFRARKSPPPGFLDPVVVDYSSPNVAKEMAVHHMRSTVIGDAVVRVLEYLGHQVYRVNHIGDWGAQFGAILAWLENDPCDLDTLSLREIEAIYCKAQQLQKEDPAFFELSRQKVVDLQSGVASAVSVWRALVRRTIESNQEIYLRLNVTLKPEDVRGESSYSESLPGIIQDLLDRGLARKEGKSTLSDLPEIKNKAGESMAVVWQNKNGAALYALTDLACVRHRIAVLGGKRLIYCVDSRQAQHFEQVWSVARKAGYIPEGVSVEFHPFGMLLGDGGKPFKTREGKTPKLIDFLEDAEVYIRGKLADRIARLPEEVQPGFVRSLAVNCIKYADLMRHRETHYRFSWQEALALEGNTACYLLYALVRAKTVLKKFGSSLQAEERTLQLGEGEEILLQEEERRLALHLLRWDEVLEKVAAEGLPHLLCHYLYEAATEFSSFYEACPIRSEAVQRKAQWRLILVERLVQRLETGLTLLGLLPLESM